VAAPSGNIPIHFKGADGAVFKVAQRPYEYSRSAPNKDATRHHLINRPVCANKGSGAFFMAQPPRLSRRGVSAYRFLTAIPKNWPQLTFRGSNADGRLDL
jgi:hypothetical protein